MAFETRVLEAVQGEIGVGDFSASKELVDGTWTHFREMEEQLNCVDANHVSGL